jgi:hypothetical protein
MIFHLIVSLLIRMILTGFELVAILELKYMKFIYFELNENYNYIIEHLDVDLIVLNPLGLIFGSMY